MKSPLWIITSALTVLLFAVIVSIVFSAKKIFEKPRTAPITVPARVELEEEKVISPKDFRMIYEDKDIFGTFKPMMAPVTVTDVLPSLPKPPFPRPVMPRQKPALQFLPQLPIKITGIIASNIEEKSQVSFLNNNTRKTTSYNVGDTVMDATVLRIFPRKVIILRSNGQQETLFMYPEDAKAEISELKDVTWNDVVQRQTETQFLVNPTSFASRIPTLAELIDALDALPVSKENEAIGIRIGKMDRSSIGFALGLQPGDLITHIADIATNSTEDRMKAYNKVVQLKMGSACSVKCTRMGRQMTLTYTLYNLADSGMLRGNQSQASSFGPQGMAGAPMGRMSNQGALSAQGRASSPDQYQGTINAMQRQDREAMNMYGSKQSSLANQGQPTTGIG